ncbi:MAG TPA: EI24 domain-containing protein [Polyangiaceae bacterium]|nr:EI24 domain-containing protein [Polyangiaceae bacterium]
MGFFQGIGAFFGGVGWVVRTPRVWGLALVPVVTALALIVVLAFEGVRGAFVLAHRMEGAVVAGVLAVLLVTTAVLLAVVLGVSLAQPLSGWALDRLVRAQERDLALEPAAQEASAGLRGALRSLASALLALILGVPLVVLLTVVGWAFPPAAVATVPLKMLVGALMLAWDLLDYPFALRGVTLGARIGWCARNVGAFTGFGLASTLFFAVPGLGLLALPCGVAGAVRLVARARRA